MVEESAAACVAGNLPQALEKAKEAVSDAPSNNSFGNSRWEYHVCASRRSISRVYGCYSSSRDVFSWDGQEYILFTLVVRCVRNEQLGSFPMLHFLTEFYLLGSYYRTRRRKSCAK